MQNSQNSALRGHYRLITQVKTMSKALELLQAKLNKGQTLLLAAHAVSKELNFGPAGYQKLVLEYQRVNVEHNYTK